MRQGAQAAAAIEVLTDIETRRRPSADALKDWGLVHRFAGSKDRAMIASLVYDALRKRSSLGWRMGDDSPRAAIIGTLGFTRGLDTAAISALFSDSPHAPEPLTEAETAALACGTLEDAPHWIRGDYPQWLDPHFDRVFGEARADVLTSLSERAPLDLRVNTLKTNRDAALAALSHLGAAPTPLSPLGIRIPLLEDGRGPPVPSEPAFINGLVEVQDEGSQLAALIAQAKPGEHIVDLCAGAGGKTLALSAGMDNQGKIFAYDRDIRRLKPLYERASRAGITNLEIRSPRGKDDVLSDLEGCADLVLVDAPCTGTGTWRRNPDAKWRLRPNALETRQKEQDFVLAQAARLVKPGGRLVYITCSMLMDENEDRLAAFHKSHPDFVSVPAKEAARRAGLELLADYQNADSSALLLNPLRSGTDGFFVAALQRG